jgi:ABC-type polysaccharide/polyol phosphate transport system ATPase subunit
MLLGSLSFDIGGRLDRFRNAIDTEQSVTSTLNSEVSKCYDKKAVLKDICLSDFYGAKIGVIGLNGSGKSF